VSLQIGTRILLGFGVALAMSTVVGVLSYRSTTELIDAANWVTHTHKVLEGASGVLSALKDAETGLRGYIITGEERYLEPYHGAATELERQIRELRELTADNRTQQERLAKLQEMAAA